MITNIDAVGPGDREEVLRAEESARHAGAVGPLEYVGMGSYGIVLCDERNHAWKVFRRRAASTEEGSLFIRNVLEDEHEWLRDAATTAIAEKVARVYAMHPEEIVLERECVRGAPGVWGQSSELGRIHGEIEKAMVPLGWTAPEYKENSYIYEFETGIPRLVDISMVQRIGMNLARFTEDVLEGRRRTHHRWHDLAFFLFREIPYRTIPRDVSDRLLARLVERDPEIRKSFVYPMSKDLTDVVERDSGLSGASAPGMDPKKTIRKGWGAEIVPLTYGRARIIVTDGFAVDENW